jgi:hypothetical protein
MTLPHVQPSDAARLKILGVAVHTVDRFAGIPLWRYSMAFAYLKAYLGKFRRIGWRRARRSRATR